MSNHDLIGDPAELAALYVTGAMSVEEHAAFEAHLAQGCAHCQEELEELGVATAALASLAPSLKPPPRVRAALLARVAGDKLDELDEAAIEAAISRQLARQREVAVAEASAVSNSCAASLSTDGKASGTAARREPNWFITRDSENDWVSVGGGGISMRMLFVDPRRRSITCLMRVPPGASIAGHVHQGSEECLVLAGDLQVGDVTLMPGDFQRTAPDFPQGDQSSASGCLLLVTSPFE